MSLMRSVVIGMLLALSHACVSGAEALADNDKKTTTESVNLFCDCAGFYLAGAMLAESQQQIGTAEKMKGLARGAEFVAKYFLAHEYAATHKDRKPYGAFSAYTEGRVESARNSVLSMIERGDKAAFEEQLAICKELQTIQEQIVQEMRDEAVDR